MGDPPVELATELTEPIPPYGEGAECGGAGLWEEAPPEFPPPDEEPTGVVEPVEEYMA